MPRKRKGSSRVACGILCKVTTPVGERAEYSYLGDVKLSQLSSTGMESGDSHRASKSVAHPPTLDLMHRTMKHIQESRSRPGHSAA